MFLRLALSIAIAILNLVPAVLAQCPPGAGSCPLPSPRPQAQAPAQPMTPGEVLGAPEGHDASLPLPWATTVRITIVVRQVGNSAVTSIGSGTIVISNAERSVVLTCSHIFRGNTGYDATAATFARPIKVDLFDGVARRVNQVGRVAYRESLAGRALDFDPSLDVGLIEIRPGRVLDRSPVVGADYTPAQGERFTTVGCDAGRDATAWSTQCLEPSVHLASKGDYLGFECRYNPPQGRSGGGIYTRKGELAGVCDFGAAATRSGIYAHPASVRAILDRNGLLEAAQRGGVSVEVDRERRPTVEPDRPTPVPVPVPLPPPMRVAMPDLPPWLAGSLGATGVGLVGWLAVAARKMSAASPAAPPTPHPIAPAQATAPPGFAPEQILAMVDAVRAGLVAHQAAEARKAQEEARLRDLSRLFTPSTPAPAPAPPPPPPVAAAA